MKKNISKIILILITFVISNSVFSQNNEEILCQEIDLGCLIIGRGIIEEHVITTNEEYQKLLLSSSLIPECSNHQLPVINFNQHSLIGYVFSVPGCESPIFSHTITREGSEYKFNVNVQKKGGCKANHIIKIWCLIPKLDENYSVSFNTIKS